MQTHHTHTLIIGSGAAGLAAALQLHQRGIRDLLIVTEGLAKGTSINTGSDKQTYYKLSLCGSEGDSPREMADTYFAGGGMHGDLALAEAATSARAFMQLVQLGVPFPQDAYGQFIGYKTDHDPRKRATSIGPYTSREMCRALIRAIEQAGIEVREGLHVVELITAPGAAGPVACGAIAMDETGGVYSLTATNVVFAVGGPGGLYATSVYPGVHTGAIGLALRRGASAQGLPESQYGLASMAFRWNVSGTYMQVVPRFISTATDGVSDAREFLCETYDDVGAMCSDVFLKGYQWPFDAAKAIGGSSLIDILVYIETVEKGRRVYLDFREEMTGFDRAALSPEAQEYLAKSGATQSRPIARLLHMNPGAVELYRDHGIDLAAEPLEIAVCAQHNNGGLCGNAWWHSPDIARLFPVGEVNGSHGVCRPGGAALNAGQVGAIRCAEYIAARCAEPATSAGAAAEQGRAELSELLGWLKRGATATRSWQDHRQELQQRMSADGAHIRGASALAAAVTAARTQLDSIEREGIHTETPRQRIEALRTRQLCFAHWVYLDAIRFQVESGVGSRGSSMVLTPGAGERVHDGLSATWTRQPENPAFRAQVLESRYDPQRGELRHRWVPRRPLPESDPWFETAWARFREGAIFGD